MGKIKKIFAVYGSGGCGRGLIPFVKQNFNTSDCKVIFVDDFSKKKKIYGYDFLKYSSFRSIKLKNKFLAIGIANVRSEKNFDKISKDKINFFSLFSKQSIIFNKSNVGLGACISPLLLLPLM